MQYTTKLGLISLLAATALAAPTALEKRTLSCPGSNGASFTASNGAIFTVECSTDHAGGDMAMQYTSSLDACIDACASTSGCIDLSWVPGSPQGPCYMKKVLGAASTKNGIHGAKLVSAGNGASPIKTSTTTATPSTTSSKASLPTPTSSSKRGVAYNSANLANLFSGTKVNWAYNWDSSTSGLDSGLEYVPMLWGSSADHTSVWAANAQKAINNGATHLLAFNEPDNPSQANLSPADAAKYYKQYMQPFAGKAKLGAPGITNGAGTWGIPWLTAFLGNCTGCTIDFVPIHWYESATNIAYFQSHVANAHAAAGVPIWVTEFAATSGTEAQIETFVSTVTSWMDNLPFIERYSYFMAMPNSLVNAAGNGFSGYGSIYANN